MPAGCVSRLPAAIDFWVPFTRSIRISALPPRPMVGNEDIARSEGGPTQIRKRHPDGNKDHRGDSSCAGQGLMIIGDIIMPMIMAPEKF
jgi:hypothetical protein